MSLIPLGFWKSSKPPIPTSGLKMYFNFEGGGYSGTTVTDFAGVQNGTLSGTTYNSGNGGYMAFDGVNDWIDTNRTTNGSDVGVYFGSWSIVYVIRVPNTTGNKYVYGCSNNIAFQGNALSGFEGANLTYTHSSGGNPTTTRSASTWYHVVCTFALGANTATVYVNGSSSASAFLETMTGAYSIYLGRTGAPATYYAFDLGLAMIYNRVLTTQEISNIYNNQRSRFGI
jgi:hypothetical protein